MEVVGCGQTLAVLRIHRWTGHRAKKRRAKNGSSQGSELSNKNGTAVSRDCKGQGQCLSPGKTRSWGWMCKLEPLSRQLSGDGEQAARARARGGSLC